MPDIRGLADKIRETVSAYEMGVSMGLCPDKKGYCLCPFHTEKTASLLLYKDTRGWYCYGCGAGGDVLELVMRYCHINIWSAIIHIDTVCRLHLPIMPYKPKNPKEKREARKLEAQYQQAISDRRIDLMKAETDAELDSAILEVFWLAGDFYNLIDAEARSQALRGLKQAENEDFWKLLKLREDARETMEDIAVYAIGCDDS